MSLLTEIFGPEVVSKSLDDVKFLIKNLAQASQKDKDQMLKEFGIIRGIQLSARDYIDVK